MMTARTGSNAPSRTYNFHSLDPLRRRPAHRAPRRQPARSTRHRLHRPPRIARTRTRTLTPDGLTVSPLSLVLIPAPMKGDATPYYCSITSTKIQVNKYAPRARGDEPFANLWARPQWRCSPHTRG